MGLSQVNTVLTQCLTTFYDVGLTLNRHGPNVLTVNSAVRASQHYTTSLMNKGHAARRYYHVNQVRSNKCRLQWLFITQPRILRLRLPNVGPAGRRMEVH